MKSSELVIFAWDGVSIPMPQIQFDVQREFELILFNYSGNDTIPAKEHILHYDQLISIKTEFKGALMLEVYHILKNRNDINYIGFVDDDMALSISDINSLIKIANDNALDVFQASVDASSFYSHQFNVHQPKKKIVFVDWVEIMMPFYRKKIFDALAEFLPLSISSYGIDKYAVPYVQRIFGLTKTAIIHTIQVKHTKPVTDGAKVFSNGLTARQEGETIRNAVLKAIKKQANKNLFPASLMQSVYEVGTIRIQFYKYRLKEMISAWRNKFA